MKLCRDCNKRLTCRSLCEAAERYVNQDFCQKKPRTLRYRNMDDFVHQKHGTYALIKQPVHDDYGEDSLP
jgi:hypothetical protein